MTEGDSPVGDCVRCGSPLQGRNRFCEVCGASASPPGQTTEVISRHSGPSQGPSLADGRGSRSGGYGCSAVMIGVLVVGFFVLIGLANGLDEGAGWAVVIFGLPALVLSAVLLLVGPWAIGKMDRRNEAEARRREREEYLRELQIRDHEERR